MGKKAIIITAVALFICGEAWAAKTTYIATNHRFNFIKLKEIKPSEAETRGMTHPAEVSEEAVRKALIAIKLDRSFLVKKEVASLDVFTEGAVNFLAPNLVKAFKQANAMEEVVFSYLCKDPIFILRNDHLNVGHAWMRGNELHMVFGKLHARLSGDYDARGEETRVMSRSRGIRVKFAYGHGQLPGASPEEIVLDLSSYQVAQTEAPASVTPVQASAEKKGKKAEAKSAEAEAPVETPADDPRARIEKLKELKKEGLINSKEYEEKRKEILKEL